MENSKRSLTKGWDITSEPLGSSRLRAMQGYACCRVHVKMEGCSPGETYTAGLNLYDADLPTFGGISRTAFDRGPVSLDDVSRRQVNRYILATKKAKRDGYLRFLIVLPVEPGTYDVQLWIAKGVVSPSGQLPPVCYKAGQAFGDSQRITVAVNSQEFYTPDYQHKMYLHPSDQSWVTLRLLVRGVWEPHITDLMKKQINEGDVVLDIGAHIGYYTLIFAKLVGESGKVFAFEPDPSNFALLEQNIKANGYSNVVPVQRAVSNRSGTINLFSDSQDAHHSVVDFEDGRASADVEAISLDDYFKDKPQHIDFIKIDIEGGEPYAIEGMSRLLRDNTDLRMMTEFFPRGLRGAGVDPTEYIKLLRGHGFAIIYNILEQEGMEVAGLEKLEPEHVSDLISRFPEKTLATNLLCLKAEPGM